MDNKIAKNIIYNILYQVITLLLPLLTVPYVSRVLGADGVGINGYTNSITQYFIIVGTLGMSLYGNRQIAYVRDDKAKMSEQFWSIMVLRIITTGIALVAYWLIFYNHGQYSLIFRLQAINIVAAMIDISWLYMGIEDFKKTITRNTVVKLVGVVLIFLFVKNKTDLPLYVFILVMMMLGGNLVMWMYVPKTVCKARIRWQTIYIHIGPALKLFIPQIAIQVYAVLDKTMIGLFSDMTQVGYYEQTEKVVKMVLGLVTSVGTVMLPRMSNIFAKGENDKMRIYLNNTMRGIAYVAIPMFVGLACISKQFVVYFFGQSFAPAGIIMALLTPILFFIAWSNIMGMQYLMPTNRTREFTFSVTMGAVTNCTFNLILIPYLGAVGACIGTVLAELTVTVIQYICLRKIIDHKALIKSVIRYFAAAMIMFIGIKIVARPLGKGVLALVLQCIIGMLIYFISLILLKEQVNRLVLKSICRFKLIKGYCTK